MSSHYPCVCLGTVWLWYWSQSRSLSSWRSGSQLSTTVDMTLQRRSGDSATYGRRINTLTTIRYNHHRLPIALHTYCWHIYEHCMYIESSVTAQIRCHRRCPIWPRFSLVHLSSSLYLHARQFSSSGESCLSPTPLEPERQGRRPVDPTMTLYKLLGRVVNALHT